MGKAAIYILPLFRIIKPFFRISAKLVSVLLRFARKKSPAFFLNAGLFLSFAIIYGLHIPHGA